MDVNDIGQRIQPTGVLSKTQLMELFIYLASVQAGKKPKLGKSLKFGDKQRKGREPPVWFRWDKKKKHSSLQLSKNCLTVTSTTTSYYQPVFGNVVIKEGVAEWEIHIKQMYNNSYALNVGVVKGNETRYSSSGMIGYSGHVNGWAYACGHGYKYHGTQNQYGKICKSGDVVKVRFDCSKKSLEFFLNGDSLGVAWSDIAPPVLPACSLYGSTIIELKFPRSL